MHVTSVLFYFLVMAVFLAEGAMLARLLPLQRRLVAEEKQGARLMTVDGLRGLLALSVFLHHGALYYYFVQAGRWVPIPSNFYAQMGVLPVTMFFFITGYLFWTKLGRRQSIPFRPFMRDRLQRLGAAYWVASLLFFFVVAEACHFRVQVSPLKLVLQAVGWASFLGAGHDLNGVEDSRFWFGQVWTLRLEWMFYLSLPFLGWFARKRVRLPLLLAGAGIVSLAAAKIALPGVLDFFWKTMGDYAQFLALTFSVGMLVAILPASSRLRAMAQSPAATILSWLLLATTALYAAPGYGWLESLLLAVPFACICLGNSWFGLLTSAAVCSLGRVSYSFYLLHIFALHFGLMLLQRLVAVASMTPIEYWGFATVCGVVAVFASYLSYQYLEHPFLRRSPAIPRVRVPDTVLHVAESSSPS